MVYIPYDVFARRYGIMVKQGHKTLEKGETYIQWVKMLDFYPTKHEEWKNLEKKWGDALKYHWTIWTPFGRKQESAMMRRWL